MGRQLVPVKSPHWVSCLSVARGKHQVVREEEPDSGKVNTFYRQPIIRLALLHVKFAPRTPFAYTAMTSGGGFGCDGFGQQL